MDAICGKFIISDTLKSTLSKAIERSKTPIPSLRVEHQTEAYYSIYKDLPLRERQARSFIYALVNEPVLLFSGEQINGVFYDVVDPTYGYANNEVWGSNDGKVGIESRIKKGLPWFSDIASGLFSDIEPNCDRTFLINRDAFPGHIAWNFDVILELGVEGLIEKIKSYQANTTDLDKADYYKWTILTLEAILEWNQKHIDALYKMLKNASEGEKDLILENIRVMEKVPAKPANTFHEALQSFYFIFLAVMYEMPYGGNSPGRLDYFLWRYLQPEYESGKISYQEACELIAELFMKIDERVHDADGHVNTIVVGGMKPDGTDAVNPLSYMILDVYQQLNITHPAVYTRISKVNPPEYIDRCVEYLINGGNRSQILSDEAMIQAITRDGHISFEDATMYVCGGCMEISPHGMNSDLLFSFLFNTPKALELAITGGICLVTGKKQVDLPDSLLKFKTFEDFYTHFIRFAEHVLIEKFKSLDIATEEMARCRPGYLISSMVSDCLERGKPMNEGGARYHDYGGTPIALQHVADSLYGIKKAVFIDKICDAHEFIKALSVDFVGYEVLHKYLTGLPKYGSDSAETNEMMERVLTDITGIISSYRTKYGGRVKPMIFNFVWSPSIGKNLGASADGRKSQKPVAHGLTPQSAGLKCGITSAIHAYTSLSNQLVSGGATTMWDLDHRWVNFSLVKSILLSFLSSGGQIFQGNMTNVDDLVKALEKPEEYHHLIVRVGGFSARFVNLDRDVQIDIIQRYRHGS